MSRWSGPAGYARIAAHHRRREVEALALGDDTNAAEAARSAGVFERAFSTAMRGAGAAAAGSQTRSP